MKGLSGKLQSNLTIFFLFFLITFVAHTIGMDLTKNLYVHPDSSVPISKFLNFPNSLWTPYVESGQFTLLEPQYQKFLSVGLPSQAQSQCHHTQYVFFVEYCAGRLLPFFVFERN